MHDSIIAVCHSRDDLPLPFRGSSKSIVNKRSARIFSRSAAFRASLFDDLTVLLLFFCICSCSVCSRSMIEKHRFGFNPCVALSAFILPSFPIVIFSRFCPIVKLEKPVCMSAISLANKVCRRCEKNQYFEEGEVQFRVLFVVL